MHALAVTRLSKWYGKSRGVEDLTFSVDRGEIFGYLGPNGSGKTTTIRCVMGLLRPSSGAVRVLGEEVVAGAATGHNRLGYLSGDFRVWPDLTGRQALELLAGLGGNHNGANGRREELAERLGLNLDRPARELSKGNRQKIGVILAFQHAPELLILDEPTSGLDPLARQTVLELIRETARDGATVLLSSHDLAEVSSICARAGILREGRLIELAPVPDIIRQGELHIKAQFSAQGRRPSASPEDLPADTRVVEWGAGENSLTLAYRGNIDATLKWLARYEVERVWTPEASLEEAFLQYYKKENGSAQGDKAS